MLLITLRIYATGGMLRTVGDVYGVSVSTVSKVVANVTHNMALLRSQFIKFPTTQEEILNVKRGFYNIAKFPNVIAALDCTHVKILSPGNDRQVLMLHKILNMILYLKVAIERSCTVIEKGFIRLMYRQCVILI